MHVRICVYVYIYLRISITKRATGIPMDTFNMIHCEKYYVVLLLILNICLIARSLVADPVAAKM